MAYNVLITGFGPFGGHEINASWEAVQLVPSYSIDNVNIVIEEIPVIYNSVDRLVPTLWRKYKPMLVVHVGVSSFARKVTIEQEAYRKGYIQSDCTGKLHCTNEVCSASEGEDCIKTLLNVDKICEHVNENTNIEACISTNAGRYLCEYTFYHSLLIDPGKVLFVHVPPLNHPYSANELAEALLNIIKCALKQLISD